MARIYSRHYLYNNFMNLVEEYILKNKGLTILISGLSGSNRSALAREIERDLKIKIFNLDNYCKKDDAPIVELLGQQVRDWDDIEVYDWDKFNSDIKGVKEKGCVVYGDIFPKSKLLFDPDFHIHIKISKEKLIEKRKEYIEKNPEKCEDMLFFLDKLEVIINKLTYPHYIKNRDDSKIDKWLNHDKNTVDEMYDQSFEYLMVFMRKFLNEYYSTHDKNINFIKETGQKHTEHKKKSHKQISSKSKPTGKSYDFDIPDLEKSYMIAPGINESKTVDNSDELDDWDSSNSSDEPIYLGTTAHNMPIGNPY